MTFSIAHAIIQLQVAPKVFDCWLRNLPDELLHANEGGDTWSPFDVIGHLIHGEKTDWIPRAEIILSRSDQPFTPFDRFAQFKNSKGKSIGELLDELIILRAENIDKLKNLGIEEHQLGLVGTHPELGEVTLKNLLATWVAHDLTHMYQVARVLAYQQKENVGVWHQYLGVMK